MANFGSGYLPGDNEEYSALICLAGAYDWDSVATGLLTGLGTTCLMYALLILCLLCDAVAIAVKGG